MTSTEMKNRMEWCSSLPEATIEDVARIGLGARGLDPDEICAFSDKDGSWCVEYLKTGPVKIRMFL